VSRKVIRGATMKKAAIVILLITVLCIIAACAPSADYQRLTTSYENLVEAYNELHLAYNNLISEHNTLASQYNALHAAYDELIVKHNKLTAEYERYSNEVEEHVKELEGYVQNLPEILEGAIVPPYLLVENRNVYIVFRDLDNNIEHWYWDVEALEASVILGQFMRKIDIPTLEYLGLRDIANRFPTGSKYVQMKEQGRCLDYTPYVMEGYFKTIASEFFSRHYDDESKIREVWNMVTQLNAYSKEITETPRLPLETLLLGGGDCEDLAILTASILKAMPAEWDISLVYMDLDNPMEINEVNHVTVYVDTGEYRTFVESTRGDIMSPWEEVNGFYLEVQ